MKNSEVIAENKALKIKNKNLTDLLIMSESENDEFRNGDITHYKDVALKSGIQQSNLDQAKSSAECLALIVLKTNLRVNSEIEYMNIDNSVIEQPVVFIGGIRIPDNIGSFFLTSFKQSRI